jgi:hypothetical protein
MGRESGGTVVARPADVIAVVLADSRSATVVDVRDGIACAESD